MINFIKLAFKTLFKKPYPSQPEWSYCKYCMKYTIARCDGIECDLNQTPGTCEGPHISHYNDYDEGGYIPDEPKTPLYGGDQLTQDNTTYGG